LYRLELRDLLSLPIIRVARDDWEAGSQTCATGRAS
jgi:hypothetical protein